MKKRDIKALVNKAIRGSGYAEKIEKASLFGSYVRGEQTKKSDLDLLMEFDPKAHITLFDLVDIQEALEKALGIKVDLLTPDALSPYIKDNILNEAMLIYER